MVMHALEWIYFSTKEEKETERAILTQERQPHGFILTWGRSMETGYIGNYQSWRWGSSIEPFILRSGFPWRLDIRHTSAVPSGFKQRHHEATQHDNAPAPV